MILSGEQVSVIIIVRNGEKYLSQAIESVLAQTFSPFEIIVVDGHSTDQTAAAAASYAGVHLVQQTETGIANARNCGIETASGALIAFLDHDDLWLPDKLARQVAALTQARQAAYCLTGFSFIGPRAGSDQPQLAGTPSVLLAKRALFNELGMFDESFQIGCDTEWFTRARDFKVPCEVIPDVLAYKRLHESNISHDSVLNRREMFRIAKMSIERERRNANDTSHH